MNTALLTLALLTAQLQPVGQASLQVLFWGIYDATLYSRSGNYRGLEPHLTLQLEYRRSFEPHQLVDETRRQWQRLERYSPQHEQWLTSLQTLWPDISPGDSLTLSLDKQLHSHFYFNGDLLGNIESTRFSEDFLAIWLSEQTQYPALRRQLIGAAP